MDHAAMDEVAIVLRHDRTSREVAASVATRGRRARTEKDSRVAWRRGWGECKTYCQMQRTESNDSQFGPVVPA